MKRDEIRRSAEAKNRRCTSRYIEDFFAPKSKEVALFMDDGVLLYGVMTIVCYTIVITL